MYGGHKSVIALQFQLESLKEREYLGDISVGGKKEI
jgi:hypothetical protein